MSGRAEPAALAGLRVLVVEDRPDYRAMVERKLREAGALTEGCGTVGEAVARLSDDAVDETRIDAAVIDWELPDGDGIRDLALRSWPDPDGCPLARILLTGHVLPALAAIDLQAAGVIVLDKRQQSLTALPRAILLALDREQIRARSASTPPGDEHVLELWPVCIDLETQRCTVFGAFTPMQPLTFRVLVYLLRRKGRVVTQDELLRDLWSGAHQRDTRAVSNQIARARAVLGLGQRFIKTAPGGGWGIGI